MLFVNEIEGRKKSFKITLQTCQFRSIVNNDLKQTLEVNYLGCQLRVYYKSAVLAVTDFCYKRAPFCQKWFWRVITAIQDICLSSLMLLACAI